jgi:hypothetical protein
VVITNVVEIITTTNTDDGVVGIIARITIVIRIAITTIAIEVTIIITSIATVTIESIATAKAFIVFAFQLTEG